MTDPNVNLVEETGTSTSLLERALARDDVAWTRLVSLYSPLVYYWCRKWDLQPRDAENLGQEVFLKVWRGFDGFRRDQPGGGFRKWLYTIAYRCFLDARRKSRGPEAVGGSTVGAMLKEIPAETPDEDPLVHRESTAILYRRAVNLIRGEFSERDWQAFQGVVLEGRPASAVAQQLGVSTNVIYITKARVLVRLRQEFAGLVDFD